MPISYPLSREQTFAAGKRRSRVWRYWSNAWLPIGQGLLHSDGRGHKCDISRHGWPGTRQEAGAEVGRHVGGVGDGRGGPGEGVPVGPFPVQGAGSCGSAVLTRGLRGESAAETASMGGKNKQRTKGNLRVSVGWPSQPRSPRLAVAGSSRCRAGGCVERGCGEACVCVSSVTSLLCVRPRGRGGLSLSRLGSRERKDVPCQSCPHPSIFPPQHFH